LPTTTASATRTCRILYYGPAGAGKRSNLAQIEASLPPEHRLAMATADPTREIAFSLRNGTQGDWQVVVQALDAGQEPTVAAGSPVPFDGIVFVCDSCRDGLDAALSAMESLKTYLDWWRLDIMSMPIVLQYNHRDGDGVQTVDQLESMINPWGLLAFPATASNAEGVRETLKAVLSLTISQRLQREVPAVADHSDGLAIDSNPPVPGTLSAPVRPTAGAAAGAANQEASLIIPVRVPRRALGEDGLGRIILEIHVVEE